MAFEFTDNNFKKEALEADVAVVDFWAEWCGPCRAITPIINQLADDYEGKAVVGKLNVDDNPEISFKFKVTSIPTILFFKNGRLFHKHVGGRLTKKTLAEKIDEALALPA